MKHIERALRLWHRRCKNARCRYRAHEKCHRRKQSYRGSWIVVVFLSTPFPDRLAFNLFLFISVPLSVTDELYTRFGNLNLINRSMFGAHFFCVVVTFVSFYFLLRLPLKHIRLFMYWDKCFVIAVKAWCKTLNANLLCNVIIVFLN